MVDDSIIYPFTCKVVRYNVRRQQQQIEKNDNSKQQGCQDSTLTVPVEPHTENKSYQ